MRKALAALCVALGLATTSCIGPNNAYDSIASWNSRLTESKWVNELAWLGLHIVPVYQFAMYGDYLIFNSVEFWSGDNVFETPEEFTNQTELGGMSDE